MTRASRQEWAKRVERWQDSGLTAQEFAKETGINARTLVYWKWRIGREARKATRRERETTGPVRFVEVVAPHLTSAPPAAPTMPGAVPAPLEVVVRECVRIRVLPDFDPTTLRRLVSTLEQA